MRFDSVRGAARWSAVLGLLAGSSSVAWARPVLQEEGGEEAEAEEVTEEDDNTAKWFAIVGGDVYTGTGGVLRGATVLAKDGVIRRIGYDLFLPEGTETLDAKGMRVYPGLVALRASSRITEGLLSTEAEDEAAPEDEAELIDPLHVVDRLLGGGHVDTGGAPDRRRDEPASGDPPRDVLIEGAVARIDAADSFDPFSQYLVLALGSGITTVEQSNTPIKLKRGEIADVAIGQKNSVTLSWSSNNPSGREQTREKFRKAAEYLRAYRDWEAEGDKKAPEPSKKGVDTNYVRILRGELFAEFSANDRSELLGIARLAQEFRFRPLIVGCMEGWTVADELGRAGATAIVTPRTTSPKREELVRPGGASIENAAILHEHGVQVAVIPGNTSFELTGITGRDLLHLPVEAGFAVRGGLSEDAALAAITLIPARILGVDHRIGTLEVGKDLDAVVTDGDILHYQTFVQYAVVSGKPVYDKQKEIFYAHIRPRPEPPAAEEPAAQDESAEESVDESAEEAGDDESGGDEADDAGDEESDESDDEGSEEGGGGAGGFVRGPLVAPGTLGG